MDCKTCDFKKAYARVFDLHWLNEQDCPLQCQKKKIKEEDCYWDVVDELYDAFDCPVCPAMVSTPLERCPRCGTKINKVRIMDNTILTTEEFYKFLEEKKNESKKETC